MRIALLVGILLLTFMASGCLDQLVRDNGGMNRTAVTSRGRQIEEDLSHMDMGF